MKKFLPSFLVFSLLLSAAYFPGISPSVQAQAPVPSCTLFPNTADVAVDSFVTVLCDQPMDSASVEAALFVTGAGGPVNVQAAMAFDPTMIFIPFASPLQPGAQYTIDLFPTAQSLAGQNLAGPEQVVFTTADAFAVFMNNHNPSHLGIDVPVDLAFPGGAAMSGLQLDFVAPMSSVTVDIIPPVAGSVVKNPAANDQQWFFQPTGDLANNTPYIVFVSGEDAAQAQAARSSFAFRTELAPGGGGDITPPTLVSTNPSDQGKNIPVDTDVVFIFDEDVEPASVQAAFIDSSGIAPQLVAHQVTVNGAEVTLTPDNDLSLDALHEVSIDSVEDLAGNALANPVSVSFTTTDIVIPAGPDVTPPTVVSHVPDSDATGVSIGANIDIEFSEDVKDFADVTLYPTADPQNVLNVNILQYALDTLTVDPDDLFDLDTAYTVEMSGIEDLAGNALVAPLSFEFTTTKEVVVFPTMFQHLEYTYTSDLEPGVMPSWLSYTGGKYHGDGDDAQLTLATHAFAATDPQTNEVVTVLLQAVSPDFLYDAQGNLNIATLMAQIVSGAQADPVNSGIANDVYRQLMWLLGAAYSLEQINYAP